MENKKSKVEDLAKFAKDGKITITHLHGPAEKYLDPVEPIEEIALSIGGNVGTIAEFLKKRSNLLNSENCQIDVCLNNNIMIFLANECQSDNKHIIEIQSRISETKHFTNLDVNNDREFEALELSRYLRKRKNMFVDSEQFQKVWTALSSFKAEISKQIEKVDSRDGNAVSSVKQEVTHNMPRHFELVIPVFENAPSIKIEIEVDVNPNSLECSLMSFDLEERYDELKKSLVESELDQEITLIGSSVEGSESEHRVIKLRDFCVTYYS